MDLIGLAAVAAALLTGVVVGLLAARRRRHRPVVEPVDLSTEVPPPILPEGATAVLAVLRGAAFVAGPHDEVLTATAAARNLALVRGSRIVVPQLLDLVRAVRRAQTRADEDLKISRGARAAATYLQVRVAPLGDGLVLVLADDLTPARRIDQARRDFVTNVSHELKTPIGAIALLAEAVELAADDPEAVRRFAGRMNVEAARLTDLVGQIIQLSRLQGRNPLSEPEVVEVDEVLADAVDRRQVDAERHDVTLTLARPSGCQVIGSARQLGVAVANLVENAVVYSDPGAKVVVGAQLKAEGDDAVVEISISDTGIGIAGADLDRIFERFYRVDYARSRANGGTGLGLSIVKHVAATHGGSVSVWSRPGQGSTFTIKIPAHLLIETAGATGEPSSTAEPDALERELVAGTEG